MTIAAFLQGVKINLSSLIHPLFAKRKIPAKWQQIGKYINHALAPDGFDLIIHCEKGDIIISVGEGEIFRVVVKREQDPVSPSVSVIRFNQHPLEVKEHNTRILEITGVGNNNVKLLFYPDNSTLSFFSGETLLFRESTAAGFSSRWARMVFQSPVKEKYAGFGQKTGRLFKNSKKFVMWNTDESNMTQDSDPLYQSCPLQISLRADGTAYGIFFDNPHYCVFQPGDDSSSPVSVYTVERGPLCYYVFPGSTPAAVTAQYTDLTGKYPLPPRWVLGHHHSRWLDLESTELMLKLARDFRTHRIPCDVLHMDIGHMNGYRCFTWHPGRFPDPGALIKKLHNADFKTVVIVDPGLKKDNQWALYREGISRDVFCKDKRGKVYHGEVWPGKCAFVDYLSDRAARWWGSLYQVYTALGVDGFWNDMNEPAVFTPRRTMPGRVVFKTDDGTCYDHKTVHNIYGLLMAKASAAGITGLRPGRRHFLFCRSSFAGIQRYASTWTGDNSSNWEHLRLSIPMLLNMGLSGQVMCGPDTGGFWKAPTKELMIRWVQLSTFYPFCRNHTSLMTPPQEFWSMGEEVKAMAREYLGLRYRLIPYLYTCLKQSCSTGLPMLRPLFLDFPGDPAVQEDEIANTEFMAGESVLVAPVLDPGQEKREVYLPAGATWIDWWGGRSFKGGSRYPVEAPIHCLPIFVKNGTVLPMGEDVLFTDALKDKPLSLCIFPGKELSGTVYLDDGITTDFKSGACSLLQITGSTAPGILSLKIERVDGNTDFPPYYLHPAIKLKIHSAFTASTLPHTILVGDKSLDPQAFNLTDNWLHVQLGLPALPCGITVKSSV